MRQRPPGRRRPGHIKLLLGRFRLSPAFQAEVAATLQRAGARRRHPHTCRHAERDAATRTSPLRV